MKTIPTAYSSAVLPVDIFQERLISIYWEKKNLEAFLRKLQLILPKELTAITLSQLSMIEKEIVWLLKDLSDYQNREGVPSPLRKC